MLTLRDRDRKLLADSDADAPGPQPVRRAVDGTPYVDRVSSSLGFAAFLEDCYTSLSSSLELMDAADRHETESKLPLPRRWPLN